MAKMCSKKEVIEMVEALRDSEPNTKRGACRAVAFSDVIDLMKSQF